MKDKKKVKLNICGTDYVIISNEDENYVKSIGIDIEGKMQSIIKANPNISPLMASVITAMNYCDELRKLSDQAENMKVRLKEYLDIAAKAQVESQRIKSEYEDLNREYNLLKIKNEGN